MNDDKPGADLPWLPFVLSLLVWLMLAGLCWLALWLMDLAGISEAVLEPERFEKRMDAARREKLAKQWSDVHRAASAERWIPVRGYDRRHDAHAPLTHAQAQREATEAQLLVSADFELVD